MHPRSLRLLELDKVIDMLKERCVTSMGEDLAAAIKPLTDYTEVLSLQQQTCEAVDILSKDEPPLSGLTDIGAEIGRAGKGGILDPASLFRVAAFLAASAALRRFMKKHAVADSWLSLAAQGLVDLPQLAEDLRRAVDWEGNVLDSASNELRSLRRKIETAESRLRSRLDSMIKSPTMQKYLQEPLVTQREGRFCLPVKSECRGQVPGVVHDQSASGATLFIEPLSSVESSNEITSLKRQEEDEIKRILRELSGRVGKYSQDLNMALEAAREIDFALAKAKLALAMDGTPPEIRRDDRFVLNNARHPLLPAKEVVPTTIALGGEYSVLVITGPNTGGKTVTLKTVGLFCLMAQCGLWLPASGGSCLPVYTNIFADIGDEQSIEQSLSTFSSHMTNIVKILDQADSRSLVLLDELGAGTDPAEGAALATALLGRLKSAGISVVATTHYSELKAYAATEPGVQNASVEFDVETLRPTYRLIIGTPGKSNAFEIALRLGLDSRVVDSARKLLNTDTRRTEDLLASLEAKRIESERALQQAREEREQAEKSRLVSEQRLQRIEEQQGKLLEQARQKSNELLRSARFEAEALLTELRQAQSQAVNVDQLARRAREQLKPLPGQKSCVPAAGTPPKSSQLPAGQPVRVLSLNKTGSIVSLLSEDEAIVQVGIMKVNVKLADLRLAERETSVEGKGRSITSTAAASISPEIDLRGQMVEEASLSLEKYLDSAMLAGLGQVSVIHGKGTGALGRGLQEYLKTHPAVSGFRYGGAGEGGSGVTVVTIKA
ncbi:MAG: endonuclease MutS2 [Eubacteriales bacterium]|nr:endonuclease MutS2 [Eubacteriales bacterium]